jgi:hypothetical protein
MDSLIEKYLRNTGVEMMTLKKNGQCVNIPEHERLVHFLIASYIKGCINNQVISHH